MIIDPHGDIVYDSTFDNIEIQSLAIDESGNVYYNGYFQEEITIGGQVVSPLKSGNYLFGRWKMTEMIESSNTGQINKDEPYGLYPNPANNLVKIDIVREGLYIIEIHSTSGQSLYSEKMEGPTHQIDLSSFQKGLYFITVRSRNYVKTEKIIKQ